MMPDAGPALTDDSTLADALDLGFALALDFTGIDLEKDFFGHLAGEAIVAVTEFDFEAIDESPEDNPVPATAMLSYRDGSRDGLQATMDDLSSLIEEYLFFFATLDTVDLGAGATATLFRIAETEYAPGYALHDGWLILGSSEEAIAAIVARQTGAGNALASNAEYRRAVGHLPAPRQALGYVNLQRIIAQVDAADLEMEPRRIPGAVRKPRRHILRRRQRGRLRPGRPGLDPVPGIGIVPAARLRHHIQRRTVIKPVNVKLPVHGERLAQGTAFGHGYQRSVGQVHWRVPVLLHQLGHTGRFCPG